ncbi:MAG: uroporphyrinogen-III synthase [Acidobacteriota bacterium]
MPPVVLTRSPDDNQELAATLRSYGLEVLEYPCVEIRVVDVEAVSRQVACVAFTSRPAVRGFFANGLDRGLRPHVVGAVGASTSAELLKNGWEATHVPAVSNAEELAAVLCSALHPGDVVLWPRGEMATESFGAILREAGLDVIERVVYVNVEPQLRPIAGPCSAVVFASPSAARRFFAANPGLAVAPVVAIGNRTAGAARDAGAKNVIESERPSNDEIARALLRAFQTTW